MKTWYELPITLLGLALMLLGYASFVLVSIAGSPRMPWLAFAMGTYGAWLAIGRRLLARRRGAQPKTQ